MADYASIAQLLALEGRVADAVRAAYTGEEDAQARMWEALCAMRDSVKEGMRPDLRSISGLTGGQAAMLGFLAVHLILFAVFYPVLTGTLTTQDYANALEWLPTWFFC